MSASPGKAQQRATLVSSSSVRRGQTISTGCWTY
jgi:hypothetical protein